MPEVVNADSFHTGEPAAPVHLVMQEAAGEGKDPFIRLNAVQGVDVLPHLCRQEVRQGDGPVALLRLRIRDHIPSFDALIGFVDSDRFLGEIEVRRCQS